MDKKTTDKKTACRKCRRFHGGWYPKLDPEKNCPTYYKEEKERK